MQQYLGNIYKIFFDVLQKKDGFSAGEKIATIEKITKQRLVLLSDKQLYEAMETYLNEPVEEVIPFTEVELIEWWNNKPNTEKIYIINEKDLPESYKSLSDEDLKEKLQTKLGK